MRTLLRNTVTRQYFQSLETWTPDREEAHDFGPVARAVRFAHKSGLSDLDVILSFDGREAVSVVSFEKFRLKLSPARSHEVGSAGSVRCCRAAVNV